MVFDRTCVRDVQKRRIFKRGPGDSGSRPKGSERMGGRTDGRTDRRTDGQTRILIEAPPGA